MADGKDSNGTDAAFTESESKFLLCALKHLEGGLNFDADAVAAELGLKDARSAKARWNGINRTKIQSSAGSPSGVKKPAAATKNTPKKASLDDNAAGGEETPGEGIPSKTPNKRGRKAKGDTKGGEEANAKAKARDMEDVVESTD